MTHSSSEVRVLVEVPEAHEPSLDLWHACARAASWAGADALRIGPAGPALAIPIQPWVELRKSVLRLDLDLVVTVRSVEEVELFRQVGVGGLAVSTGGGGGGDAVREAAGQARLPLLLLSEVPDDPDLEPALACLGRYDVDLTVLFGSLERPTPAERLGWTRSVPHHLGRQVRTCFADRTGTGWPALAACALGADAVELPIALSPYLGGSEGALTPEALRHTVEGLRYLAWARAHEVGR